MGDDQLCAARLGGSKGHEQRPAAVRAEVFYAAEVDLQDVRPGVDHPDQASTGRLSVAGVQVDARADHFVSAWAARPELSAVAQAEEVHWWLRGSRRMSTDQASRHTRWKHMGGMAWVPVLCTLGGDRNHVEAYGDTWRGQARRLGRRAVSAGRRRLLCLLTSRRRRQALAGSVRRGRRRPGRRWVRTCPAAPARFRPGQERRPVTGSPRLPERTRADLTPLAASRSGARASSFWARRRVTVIPTRRPAEVGARRRRTRRMRCLRRWEGEPPEARRVWYLLAGPQLSACAGQWLPASSPLSVWWIRALGSFSPMISTVLSRWAYLVSMASRAATEDASQMCAAVRSMTTLSGSVA